MNKDKTNIAALCGWISEKPTYSHSVGGRSFYSFILTVDRLSGTGDRLQIICPVSLLESLEPDGSPMLRVVGELRSHNNKSGVGSKLQIFVYAYELSQCCDSPENYIYLRGALCKKPILRTTPLGREICDLLLAVNRSCGHSDYLPCIAWGRFAQTAASLSVGASMELEGRLQSRSYIKNLGGVDREKIAYEVSASALREI